MTLQTSQEGFLNTRISQITTNAKKNITSTTHQLTQQNALGDGKETDALNADFYRTRWIYKDASWDHTWTLEDYNKALKLDSSNMEIHISKWLAQCKLWKHKEAIASFGQIIKSNKKLIYEWCNKESYTRISPERSKTIFEAYTYRWNAKGYLGNHQWAIADYTNALQFEKHNCDVYMSRSTSKHTIGDIVWAKEDFDRFLKIIHVKS